MADKIQKFYSSCYEYLEKKRQIEQMSFDLKCILDKVNDDLNDIIDNGFQTEYLVGVADEYKMHKFESKVVQDFCQKIDKLLFEKLDISKKDRLEIVSLRISISYHHSYDDAYINGPIAVDFIDVISNRSFTIFIPVKKCAQTDVLHWTQNGNGLYIVSVDTDKFGARDICRVFDPSKAADAVEKLLNGDFDEDLSTIDISDAYEKRKYLFVEFDGESYRHDVYKLLSKALFADEYDDDYYYFKRRVPNCIDDTRNFR